MHLRGESDAPQKREGGAEADDAGQARAGVLADIYHRLSLSGLLAGYEVQERFYEIGSHQGLAEAAEYFKGREN